MSAAATVIENAEPISVEQLEATSEWAALSPRQKMFVRAFIETGDAVLAVRQAYDCKSDRNFKIQSYDVAGSPKVQAALNRYRGQSERDAFIARLERQIKRGEITVAMWNATKLLVGLKGWSTSGGARKDQAAVEPQSPETRHQVGDIVLQNNSKYRVTKINAVGRILEADEVE